MQIVTWKYLGNIIIRLKQVYSCLSKMCVKKTILWLDNPTCHHVINTSARYFHSTSSLPVRDVGMRELSAKWLILTNTIAVEEKQNKTQFSIKSCNVTQKKYNSIVNLGAALWRNFFSTFSQQREWSWMSNYIIIHK